MKTITVKVTDEQYACLTAAAKARAVSRSAVVRDTIDAVSSGHQSSLLERMEDIVGSAEGPADLSTNKKYLKNYGLSRADRRRSPRRHH